MPGVGGEEVSILPVVYPCETVSVSTLGYFSSIGSSSKTSHSYLTVSLGARHIQYYIKNKRGRKRKFNKPQQDKPMHEKRIIQSTVIVQEKLVVGC